ncbi:MAG: hypothetical protein EBZ77_18175 [Chitinophagia bacterium]|nr:hypothetical protein [Chitinophagia bacterium]
MSWFTVQNLAFGIVLLVILSILAYVLYDVIKMHHMLYFTLCCGVVATMLFTYVTSQKPKRSVKPDGTSMRWTRNPPSTALFLEHGQKCRNDSKLREYDECVNGTVQIKSMYEGFDKACLPGNDHLRQRGHKCTNGKLSDYNPEFAQ